jgi:hypothetical protein
MKTYTRYWKDFTTTLIVLGLMFSSTPVSAAGIIAYEQPPGHFGGVGSDGPLFTVADEFQLDQSTLIKNITWWGGYYATSVPGPGDNFTIQLFADSDGQPGTLIQAFNIPSYALMRTATGDLATPPDPEGGFAGTTEFKYSFNLPTPFWAEANTRYWLSIINVPGFGEWLWEASDSLTNLGIQRSFLSGPWEINPYDNVAFRLQTIEGTPLSADIDIKPGDFPNNIKLNGKGTISVAILSSSTFNALSDVDRTSLTFGRTGEEASLIGCSSDREDVNKDKRPDLVCRFNPQAMGFQSGDTVGILKGMALPTYMLFSGIDSVNIMP